MITPNVSYSSRHLHFKNEPTVEIDNAHLSHARDSARMCNWINDVLFTLIGAYFGMFSTSFGAKISPQVHFHELDTPCSLTR